MSVPARRDRLVSYKLRSREYPNAGLWFDRYLSEQKSDANKMEPYVSHIKQVAQLKEPPAYEAFFTRWKTEFKKVGVSMRHAHVVGRVAAGLGGESVIENGMKLHQTYGVPVIPGSSLKGTARAYAAAFLDDVWGKSEKDTGEQVYGEAFKTLFGTMKQAGVVIFFDALPIPSSWKIHNEIMTVHHPEYYQNQNEPPADWDSPTPIPFPSVSGSFLIALYAPTAPMWAVAGMNILQMALTETGIGGKTSSGYGRFDLAELPLSPEEQQMQTFFNQLDGLSTSQVASQIHSFVNRWRTSAVSGRQKQQMAQAILDKVEEAKRTKKSSGKGWYQELVHFVEGKSQ